MKKFLSYFSKKSLCLAGAALVLAASLTVGKAAAYFTTYATATGGMEVDLGFTRIVPDEEVYDWTKHIKIDNTGDYPCYVRAKVFAGEKFQAGLVISGEGWTLGEDGYYYYKDIIPAGGSTADELLVKIDNMDSKEDFNVVVIQECAPVLYDENGNPYADWDMILDTSTDSYQ